MRTPDILPPQIVHCYIIRKSFSNVYYNKSYVAVIHVTINHASNKVSLSITSYFLRRDIDIYIYGKLATACATRVGDIDMIN